MRSRNLFFCSLVASVVISSALYAFEPLQIVRVNTLNLNVRSGPGSTNEVIVALPEGALMVFYREVSGWANVGGLHNGVWYDGWVNKIYLVAQEVEPKPAQVQPIPVDPSAQYIGFNSRTANPLRVSDLDFDCYDSRGEGLQDCSLEIDYEIWIPEVYQPYLKDYLYIKCEATVEYEILDSWSRSEDDSDEKIQYISEHGMLSTGSVKLRFDLESSGEVVTEARVADHDCEAR